MTLPNVPPQAQCRAQFSPFVHETALSATMLARPLGAALDWYGSGRRRKVLPGPLRVATFLLTGKGTLREWHPRFKRPILTPLLPPP